MTTGRSRGIRRSVPGSLLTRPAAAFPAAFPATCLAIILAIAWMVVPSRTLAQVDSSRVPVVSERHAAAHPAVLTPTLDPARLLEGQPGVLVYDLSTPGWPTSTFVRGTSPNDVGLAAGRSYFNDAFSGRPRYDLVPVQLSELPRVAGTLDGYAHAMSFQPRAFDAAQPQTEATYWSSNKDLQHARIVHAQRRLLSASTRGRSAAAPGTTTTDTATTDTTTTDTTTTGTTTTATTTTGVGPAGTPPVRSAPPDPTILDMLITYHGAAANGEFPGSKLERARQFGTRVGVQRPRFGFMLQETYNGRSVGAHSGVNPPIYQRLGASVQNATARRWSRRNDLAASGWTAVGDAATVHALASWTEATERYTSSTDTVEARSRRFVGEARATLPWLRSLSGSHMPPEQSVSTVFLRAETAEVTGTRGFDGAATVSDVQAGAELNVHRRRWEASARAGLQRTGGRSGPFAAATLSAGGARTRVTATAGSSLRRAQLVDVIGFGDYLTSTTSTSGNTTSSFDAERASTLDVEAFTHVGALRVGVSAFQTVRNNPIEYYETTVTDSVFVTQADGAVRIAGAGAQLAFRDSADSGFYLRVRGDTYTVAGGAAAGSALSASPGSGASTATANAIAGTLPDLFGVGQIGFRQTLFQGDLIADLAVRGRAWTAMRSRVLHPQTGLLVVPTTDVTNTAEVPASGALDIVLTARVRTATIWFLYENALSGTNVMTGNVMVPGYPLEEQRIRFGVHWPIFG